VAGWLISASDNASGLVFVLALVGLAGLTLGIVALHRQIERRIEKIGKL
jgi:hypothetical protein